MSVGAEKIAVTVAEVVEVNELIKRFRFVRRDGGQMPHFRRCACGGRDDDHGTGRMNLYSLMSAPATGL